MDITTRTHLLDEEWIVAIEEIIASQPETLADVVEPHTLGYYAAAMGQPCEPLDHYGKLGDIEMYILGWREATGLLDERGDAIEDDHDWIRHGC